MFSDTAEIVGVRESHRISRKLILGPGPDSSWGDISKDSGGSWDQMSFEKERISSLRVFVPEGGSAVSLPDPGRGTVSCLDRE